jgi:hypothetical protein
MEVLLFLEEGAQANCRANACQEIDLSDTMQQRKDVHT